MERFFADQKEIAAHRLEVAYANTIKVSDEQKKQIEDVLAAYSFEDWQELIPEIQSILGVATEDAALEAMRQVAGLPETATAAEIQLHPAIGVNFDVVNAEAARYAQERSAELVGMRFVDGVLVENPNPKWAITDSTREWLRDAITSAFEDGMSPAQLSTSIRDSLAWSESRSDMVAHTEIGNANMVTLEATSRQFGATHKRSFLSSLHDIDDVCDDAAEAGEVPIDYVYDGGASRPLYHPRCMCSESYYVRKPKK